MTLKHRKRGSGITEQLQLVMTPDNIPETLEHASANSTFEGSVTDIEAVARSVLVSAGADPDKPSTYIDRFDEDSREDYAGRILQRISQTRTAIKKYDAAGAAYYGLKVGWLTTEADMKFEWEDHALRGRNTILDAKRGHEEVHGTDEEKHERWAAMSRDFYAEVDSGTGKTAAYEIVAERHKVSSKTVRRAVKRLS